MIAGYRGCGASESGSGLLPPLAGFKFFVAVTVWIIIAPWLWRIPADPPAEDRVKVKYRFSELPS